MTLSKSTFPPLSLSYGLFFSAMLAILSYSISNLSWMAATGISSLVIAIILGMMIGNIGYLPERFSPGIQFSAKRLLRAAIILYGFRISFQQIVSVGALAFILDGLIVSMTLTIGYVVGRKCLKLDRDLALLISAGAAICGAAAVLAVEDILKSEPHKAVVAIGTVVLFGTISMFLYPLLQHAGLFGLSDHQFGVLTGASIHEVAQALVAGANISTEAGKTAVIVKMIRVLLLVPVLLLFSFFSHRRSETPSRKKTRLTIPWFAIGFVVVIGFNSLQLLPLPMVNLINQFDILLLTMAMGAMGLETKLSKIKKVGPKPLYLAFILFGWLMSSAYVIVRFA